MLHHSPATFTSGPTMSGLGIREFRNDYDLLSDEAEEEVAPLSPTVRLSYRCFQALI